MAWKFDNPWEGNSGSNMVNPWDIEGKEAEKAIGESKVFNDRTSSEITNLLPEGDNSTYYKIASELSIFKEIKTVFSTQQDYSLVFIEGNSVAIDGDGATLKWSNDTIKNFFSMSKEDRETSSYLMCSKLKKIDLLNNEDLLKYLETLVKKKNGVYLICLKNMMVKGFSNTLSQYSPVLLEGLKGNIETIIHELYCHVYTDIKSAIWGDRYGYGKSDAHRYYYASNDEKKKIYDAVYITEKYDERGYIKDKNDNLDSVFHDVLTQASDGIKSYLK